VIESDGTILDPSILNFAQVTSLPCLAPEKLDFQVCCGCFYSDVVKLMWLE